MGWTIKGGGLTMEGDGGWIRGGWAGAWVVKKGKMVINA